MRLPFLTGQLLAEATTRDVRRHYKMEWEETPTTHYDDVFAGTEMDIIASSSAEETEHMELGEGTTPTTTAAKTIDVKRISTFSAIDYVAENFASVNFTVILWVVLVLAYFAYVANVSKPSRGLLLSCLVLPYFLCHLHR